MPRQGARLGWRETARFGAARSLVVDEARQLVIPAVTEERHDEIAVAQAAALTAAPRWTRMSFRGELGAYPNGPHLTPCRS